MRVRGGFKRLFVVLLLALPAAGCSHLGGLFGPSQPDFAAQMPALEARVLVLVEEERQKINPQARALKLDPELVDVARKRSAAMAAAKTFTSPDPHASATMLMRQDAKFQGLVGENVAAQYYRPQLGIDVDAFAHRFVESWLASGPHKSNLSFADYDHTGIGAAVNGDTVYITQLFTTDLGLTQTETDASSVASVPSPQQGKDEMQPVPLRGAISPTQ